MAVMRLSKASLNDAFSNNEGYRGLGIPVNEASMTGRRCSLRICEVLTSCVHYDFWSILDGPKQIYAFRHGMKRWHHKTKTIMAPTDRIHVPSRILGSLCIRVAIPKEIPGENPSMIWVLVVDPPDEKPKIHRACQAGFDLLRFDNDSLLPKRRLKIKLL